MTGSGGEVLRVGLVGCGLATQSLHVPALQFLAASYRISAVADASDAVAAAVAARTGARVVEDAFRLVEDPEVDVVAICTPDAFHLDHALAACEARRRAVLVEKPMTLNARMGRVLAEAAARTGVPVLVNYPHVYDYATQRVREVWGAPGNLTSGEFHCFLGNNDDYIADVLQMIRPPGPPEPWVGMIAQLDVATAATEVLGTAVDLTSVVGYGIVLGLTIHDIPVLRRFAGDRLAVAHARFRPGPEALGIIGFGVDAVLETPSGTLILQSEFSPLKRTDWGFRIRRPDLQAEAHFPTTFAPAAPSRCSVWGAEAGATLERRYTDFFETGFRRAWRHLHDVVIRGAPPETPASDAVRDLEIVEEIAAAASRRRA
jgi:predicted dehydrogenase